LTNATVKAIGIGEVLLDIFENSDSSVGGAPLNAIFHVNQLMLAFNLGEACIVSRIGEDLSGYRVLDYLIKAGMNVEYVSRDTNLPTGTALVFTEAGHAGYEIAQNVAWDFISTSSAVTEFASKASAVVFGSLAQRSPVSRDTVRHLVMQVDGERLYDVNLRRNARSLIAGYSEEIIRSSLELATIAKLSDEELEKVAAILQYSSALPMGEPRQWELMMLLAEQFQLSIVALTRGAKGALVLCDGEHYRLHDSSLPQDQVHPVGAGDAFTAGLLFGRMVHWEIDLCLELAETMANWVVQHASATPRLTDEIMHKVLSIGKQISLTDISEPVA
jgi:fructokinase